MEPPRKRALGVDVPPARAVPLRPPRKDPRVDSPEPFPAVIPEDPAPARVPEYDRTPELTPSMFASFGTGVKRVVTIVVGTCTVVSACAVAGVQTYREISKPAGNTTDDLQRKIDGCLESVDAVEKTQNAHLKSDASFRRAVGAVFAKNPDGEIILRGVDQDSAKVWSEKMGDEDGPPISRVSEEAIQLPTPQ